MSRSSKKIIYVHKSLFKSHLKISPKKKELRKKAYKMLLNIKLRISPQFMLWKRDNLINKRLIGQKVAIYNGYYFMHNTINKDLLGFKLGQLNVTRRTPKHKGKQRQKKKSY